MQKVLGVSKEESRVERVVQASSPRLHSRRAEAAQEKHQEVTSLCDPSTQKVVLFTCEVCQRLFLRRWDLSPHKCVAPHDLPRGAAEGFTCDTCNRSFKRT